MQRLNVEFVRNDERGMLIQVNTGEWKQVNYLLINKNQEFGGHYHKHKRELFYVIKGELNVQIIDKKGGQNVNLKSGECVLIEPYDIHTLFAVEDSEIVELLSEPFDKGDIYE